jgi:phospholipid N-methyltransferase
LHCFELDRVCYRELRRRIRDPRVRVYHKSAECLEEELDDFDCVVSGLPLTSINEKTARTILKASQKAKRFIQYKYFPSDKLLSDFFGNIREERIGIHVIYVCENNGLDRGSNANSYPISRR